MKFIASVILLTTFHFAKAQQLEEAAVKKTINLFFEGMKSNDTLLINTTLDSTIFFYSINQTATGKTILQHEKLSNFLEQVAKLKGQKIDEQLQSFDIKIDGAIAIAWTPYKFYFNDKFSHCGVNVFTMIKRESGWKILGITDTRRKQGCE
jgi:hypothetical protein